MPETTVNKYRSLPSGKDNIGLTGKLISPERKSEAHAVQHGPNLNLWSGIPMSDPAHIPASMFWRESVSHLLKIIFKRTEM
jgi:hypothetical protein